MVKDAQALGFPVFVVDDGSTDNTYEQIKEIEGIQILRHQLNQGKGAAVMTGFAAAAVIADWAITIDADGQHYPQDAIKLINAIPANVRAIVVGAREGMGGMEGAHIPWTSRFGRKFSNFWVWAAGGAILSDSQSGMRLYPLPEAMQLTTTARRFQFEVEILVMARRKNLKVVETPVRVIYNPDGKRISHFRPFVDFLRNAQTFSRLIFNRIFSLR